MPGQVHKIGRQVLELVVPQEPGVRQVQDAFRDLFYARLLPILERVLDDMVPPDRLIRLERLELNLGSTGWDLDPEPLEEQLEFRLRQQMEQILNSVQVEEARPLGELDAGDADWNLLLHYLVYGEVPEWLSPADFKPDAQLVRMLQAGDTKQIALLRKVMALPVVLLRVAWGMSEATRTLALDRLLPGRAVTVRQIHADLSKLHQRQPLLPMEASMFAYRLWESSLSMVTLLPETAVSATDILPIYLQSLLPQPIFRPRDRVWLLMRSIAAIPTGELSGETVQAVAEMASLAGIDAALPVVSAKPLEQADAEKVNAKQSAEAESKTSESPANPASENEQVQVDSPPSAIEAAPIVPNAMPSEIEASTSSIEERTPGMDEGTLDQRSPSDSVESETSKESPASLKNEAAKLTEENDLKPLSETQLLEESPESRHLLEKVDAKESAVPPTIPEEPTIESVESVEAKKEIESPDSRTTPETPGQESEDQAPEEVGPKEELPAMEGREQPKEALPALESPEQPREELPAGEGREQRKEPMLALEGSEQPKEQSPISEGASVGSNEVETQHLPESETKPLREETESTESVIIDGPDGEHVHSQQKPPVLDSEEAEIQVSQLEEPSPESQQPIQKSALEPTEQPVEKDATPVDVNPESVSTSATGEQPQDTPETLLRSPEEDGITDRFRRFREQWAQNPESLIPRTQSEPLHIPWRQNDPKHGMGVLYAGLVIAWPYIGPLFKRLEWLEKREFVSPEAQFAAVHLLRYVATGTLGEVQDHELGFCKVMAGLHPTDPVPTEIPLTEAQCAAADEMVDAVIANWGAVKRTSRAGLRQTFLQRAGNIRSDENGWIVHLERETMDILLDRIPWGYSTIRLGWQPKMIFVQW